MRFFQYKNVGLFGSVKHACVLALLSAQVCFAGTPLSNKDSEPAKKATTAVVTPKTSADAASAVQDKQNNPAPSYPCLRR